MKDWASEYHLTNKVAEVNLLAGEFYLDKVSIGIRLFISYVYNSAIIPLPLKE